MIPPVHRLFAPLPSDDGEEQILPLIDRPGFRLEHIVSKGRPTKPGFWYDQPDPEWVLLLRGTATLDFGSEGKVVLGPGDTLLIPARSKHRVEAVSEDAVWLGLHFDQKNL